MFSQQYRKPLEVIEKESNNCFLGTAFSICDVLPPQLEIWFREAYTGHSRYSGLEWALKNQNKHQADRHIAMRLNCTVYINPPPIFFTLQKYNTECRSQCRSCWLQLPIEADAGVNNKWHSSLKCLYKKLRDFIEKMNVERKSITITKFERVQIQKLLY